MIPAQFDYHRPATVAEAAALMARHGDRARLLAGGHSLIPMMKLRMTDLDHLIDLQGCAELRGVCVDGDGVVIGAMTTQAELVASELLTARLPILRETSLQIADPQVRYVGTLGGNLANGDPGNDLPALMMCLNAAFRLQGPAGTRDVAARGFYRGPFDTLRAEDEVLASVRIPFPAAGTGWAYEKQKRKIGDYATAAAAVTLRREGGAVAAAAVALTNLADRPILAEGAAAALVGRPVGEDSLRAAVAAMQEAIDPASDNRGPAEFKRHAAGAILRRAILRAAERAA